MIVKLKDKQLLFTFQETDPFFDMAYMILEQANIVQMLPYSKMQQSGKEKLLFDARKYELLKDVLPVLSQEEVVNVLFAIMAMVEKVEENGFLKKECIWMNFEHIFFDTDRKIPMFAILPVNREVKTNDKIKWISAYNDAIAKTSKYLVVESQKRVTEANSMWQDGKMKLDEMLESVNELGDGMSGILVNRTKKNEEMMLSLTHTDDNADIIFEVRGKQFIIGKKESDVDGVLNISEAVSRKHCMIIKQGQRFFVQDLGSTNHTFVNGEFIPQMELMELMEGDILSIANVDFKIHIYEK